MFLRDLPRIPRGEFRPSRWGGRPVVVLDNTPGWGASERWDPDHLRLTAGETEVSVREVMGPPRNIFQNLAAGGRIAFSEYLDWVLDTADQLAPLAEGLDDIREISAAVCASDFEVCYYLDADLARLSPTLMRETPIPDWYPSRPLDVNLWCGVMGTSSGLHSDITPNCNMQIVGEKHFYVFPPSESRRLYRIPQLTHCRFDPNVPDFDRFPRAEEAHGWQCVLTPGESLYIPAGWYHQVTVKSPWALNVNVFWPRPFPEGLMIPSLWTFLLRRWWARARRWSSTAAHRTRRQQVRQ